MSITHSPDYYSVSGIIHTKYNYPLPNVKVQVLDQDLRSEQLLGEKMTDVNGFYNIQFNKLVAAPSEKKNPDIFIKDFDNNRVVGQSDVIFNVNENTIINFTIGNLPFNQLNEFETLFQSVNQMVTASKLILGRLVNSDIVFLSKELDVKFENIRLLNNSFFNHAKTGISAAAYFGLFRTGIISDDNKLLNIPNLDLVRIHIKQATDQNLISAEIYDDLDNVIILFKKLRGSSFFT